MLLQHPLAVVASPLNHHIRSWWWWSSRFFAHNHRGGGDRIIIFLMTSAAAFRPHVHATPFLLSAESTLYKLLSTGSASGCKNDDRGTKLKSCCRHRQKDNRWPAHGEGEIGPKRGPARCRVLSTGRRPAIREGRQDPLQISSLSTILRPPPHSETSSGCQRERMLPAPVRPPARSCARLEEVLVRLDLGAEGADLRRRAGPGLGLRPRVVRPACGLFLAR